MVLPLQAAQHAHTWKYVFNITVLKALTLEFGASGEACMASQCPPCWRKEEQQEAART